ncbi:MAG: hypothetical protein ACTSRI_16580 [Promethearchaeota archaeon]
MAIKGIFWGFIFFLSALIYITIPTYLVVTFWIPLNELTVEGEPVYTYALFAIFLFAISIIVSVIYVVAMLRAFIQRKNEDLGIPKGVKGFGLVSTIIIITIMIIWYVFFNELAFFSMKPI